MYAVNTVAWPVIRNGFDPAKPQYIIYHTAEFIRRLITNIKGIHAIPI